MRHAEIDPLSNLIRPRQVVLRRDMKGFIVGPWPKHHIQSFLHELTHHWCFHSPLGATLALLRARALRRPFARPDGQFDGADGLALLDDMLASDIPLRLLRPLSEGMALFAEYDMRPGPSRIVTTPMTWAVLMLSSRTAIPNLAEPSGARELTRKLGDMRLEAGSLRRKMAFLSRPLSELDQAYCDGYLSVKRIYHDLRARSEMFHDADLFLSYMRSYFFEDPGTVAILTRSYDNPQKRLIDYLNHFTARLKRLYEPDIDIDEDARLFEEACNTPAGHWHDFGLPGIGSTTDEQQEARKAHRGMLHELEDAPFLHEPFRSILNAQRGQLSRRAIAFVFSEPALIKIGANRMVSVWPDPPDDEMPLWITGCLAAYTHEATAEPVRGWMSLIIIPTQAFIAPICGIDDQVVAIAWPPRRERDSELEEWLADPLHAPPVIERELQDVGAWVTGYFKGAPPEYRTIIDAARASTAGVWLRVATALRERWTFPPSADAAAALYRRERLWGYFTPDQQKFETFVALGTLPGIDTLEPSIQRVLSENGWDVQGALCDALRIKKETGLDLIRNDNGVVEWLI